MSAIIRRVGLYGVATVLPSAVTFIFLPILTRQMPKADFGTMSALTALNNLFFIAFTFYLDRSLGRLYFCHQGRDRKELIGSLFLAVAGIATVGIFLTAGLSPWFEKLYPEISARRLTWYGTSIYFNVIVYFARTYYTSAEKPVPYLWISMGLSAALIAAMCWFILVRGEGVDGWLKAQILANFIVAVPCAIAITRICVVRLQSKFIREALVYAGPMIPAFFCNWLSGSVDRLFVGRWAGMSNNALYGAATQLSNILQVMFLPVFITYMPLFYRLAGAGDEERKVALTCNRLLLLLIAVAGCLLIMVAPLLAGTVLPSSYRGVSGTFAWLIVAGCFAQAAGISTTALYHVRRTDLVLVVSAAAAAASVVADISLIPSMGRQGAVIGQLLSAAVLAAGQFVFAWRTYGQFIGRSFALRSIGAVLLMGALAEAQARTGHLALWLVLETLVLGYAAFQIWAEKSAVMDLWTRNLWQAPPKEQTLATS